MHYFRQQFLKMLILGFFWILLITGTFWIVKAWQYEDPELVTDTDTLTATKRNAVVESLFWHRDGTSNIVLPNGNVKIQGLSGVDNRCLYVDNTGTIHAKNDDCGIAGTSGDDFGSHIATQNISLNNNRISNDADDEGIKIDANGNVGIGVTTPSAPLDLGALKFFEGGGNVGIGPDIYMHAQGLIATDSSLYINIDGDNSGNGGLQIAKGSKTSNGNPLVTLLNDGKMGIGNSSPSEMLEVAGNIALDGNIIPDGFQLTNGVVHTNVQTATTHNSADRYCASIGAHLCRIAEWAMIGDGDTLLSTNEYVWTDGIDTTNCESVTCTTGLRMKKGYYQCGPVDCADRCVTTYRYRCCR